MIRKENAVAICIDLQEKIMPAMWDAELVTGNCKKLISGLKVENVPIYVTQQYTKGLGGTLADIREVLGSDEYIEKITYSAYPVLKDKIKSPQESKYVIIFGIESHVCVLQTAIEFKENGYQPVLVADCMMSRKKEDYDLAIIRAQQEGILVTGIETVLFELDRQAGTPEAKAIQKIVR